MSYLSYGEYKNINTVNLRVIPKHWKKKPMKFMAQVKNGQDYKHVEVSPDSNGFPVIGSGGQFSFASQSLYSGESVLLGRKGTIDKPLYIKGAFWTVDTMFYTIIKVNTIPKYLYYSALTIPFDFYSTNTALPSMTQADLCNHIFAYPPIDEQMKIVNFLDKETAKIDILIEKQKQLIQLLEEKRQSVISHAVTKGLNPNIKMKDSGVEWLGYVPEHWKIRRIKMLFQIRKRIAGTLGYDILSITQKGIKVKDIESGEGQLSMDYTKYQLVNVGDFAMNHMDLLTGWVDISKQRGVTSPDYRVFSLTEKQADPKYYLYVLQMGYNQKIFYAYGQGSSHLGRWRFPTEAFQSFYFPFPPEDEQKEISDFIENVHLKISNLVEKSKKVIALSNERRTALISAAVTGKIDVRNIT